MQSSTEQVSFKYHQELGGIEMVNAKFNHQNFSKHSHETYTINVIEQGAQRFLSCGSKFVAPEQSIIFVNADEVHTGQSENEGGWSYRGISPLESQFSQLAADVGFSDNFAPYFPEAVVQDKQLASELRALFEVLENSDNSLLRETLLYGVLTRLMLKYSKNKSLDKHQVKADKRLDWVRQYIHANIERNVSLEKLADIAQISPFYLVRQFQKNYGLPPHAYQIQQRLQLSKQLLRRGDKVANVATQVGFFDQSHLHRHFKKAYGITPNSYTRQFS